MCFHRLAAVMLAGAMFLGCGRSGQSVKTPTTSPAEMAKAALKEVADTGVMGSGMLTVRENLEKIQSSDPAKGAALMKDFQALEKARTPQEIQMRARELMSKL